MASRPLLLDLFCGAGGAAMGYHRAGFEVLGVDITPQPHYPFRFVQANALEFLIAHLPASSIPDLAAIHASPPCQRWSPISRYQRVAATYPDLIAPTRKLLERFLDVPYVLENVPEAPVQPDVILCGHMFGLPIIRHRAFESNLTFPAPPAHSAHQPPLSQSWSGYNRLPGTLTIVGHTFSLREGREAMGMPWVRSREELAEAIPPAYTEWIGRQLLEALDRAA